MRKFIPIMNLVSAILAALASLPTLVSLFSHTPQRALPSVLCIIWTLCAVKLLSSQRLWPWVGSMVAVAAATLQVGAETLRFLTLFWRAEYGDMFIKLDPTTVGAPLAISGLFTVALLLIL